MEWIVNNPKTLRGAVGCQLSTVLHDSYQSCPAPWCAARQRFFVINFYGFPGQHLVRCSLSSPAAGIQTRRAVDNGSGDTKVGPRSLLADRHLSSKPVMYVTNLFLVEVAGDASAYPSPV